MTEEKDHRDQDENEGSITTEYYTDEINAPDSDLQGFFGTILGKIVALLFFGPMIFLIYLIAQTLGI